MKKLIVKKKLTNEVKSTETDKESLKKEICDTLIRLSGNYSVSEIFKDFVKCCAISISNVYIFNKEVRDSREKEYMSLVNKHEKDTITTFSKLLANVVLILESSIEDVLGDIYMKLNIGNSHIGQFFTPSSVSELCAGILVNEINQEWITLHEPCVGSGGMIIAYAKSLHKQGINYQARLKVTACDLDWTAVYMSFVQFSLLGINAVVIQGNTLENNFNDPKQFFYTPKHIGMF